MTKKRFKNGERVSKTSEVLHYMQKKGKITSIEAIRKFGATRLSAIIYDLRKRYDIESVPKVAFDRNGYRCPFVEYRYKGAVGE